MDKREKEGCPSLTGVINHDKMFSVHCELEDEKNGM